MRVLHVTGDNGLGGTETILQNIAKHAAGTPDIAHEFVLFPTGPLADALVAAGATTYVLGGVRLRQPWRVIHARSQFKKLLARNRYDAVVFHQYSWIPLILSDLASGIPQVRWFHNAPGLNWTERWLLKTNPGFPGLSIYCSEYLRAQLHSRGKSAVLHAPVTPPELRHAADRLSVRAELGTSPDSTVIIHVGRMTEIKGQRVLIEALARLLDRFDWICWMVGGAQTLEQSAYFQQLEELARSMGLSDRIRFTGNRSDVARLMAAADVYCQPNLQPEAFGIAFVEALYAGLPVVSTGFGGAVEIVDDSCGVLVTEATPEAVSEAIRKLLENPAMVAKLACGSRPRARQLCDADTQVRRLGQVLLSLNSTS